MTGEGLTTEVEMGSGQDSSFDEEGVSDQDTERPGNNIQFSWQGFQFHAPRKLCNVTNNGKLITFLHWALSFSSIFSNIS